MFPVALLSPTVPRGRWGNRDRSGTYTSGYSSASTTGSSRMGDTIVRRKHRSGRGKKASNRLGTNTRTATATNTATKTNAKTTPVRSSNAKQTPAKKGQPANSGARAGSTSPGGSNKQKKKRSSRGRPNFRVAQHTSRRQSAPLGRAHVGSRLVTRKLREHPNRRARPRAMPLSTTASTTGGFPTTNFSATGSTWTGGATSTFGGNSSQLGSAFGTRFRASPSPGALNRSASQFGSAYGSQYGSAFGSRYGSAYGSFRGTPSPPAADILRRRVATVSPVPTKYNSAVFSRRMGEYGGSEYGVKYSPRLRPSSATGARPRGDFYNPISPNSSILTATSAHSALNQSSTHAPRSFSSASQSDGQSVDGSFVAAPSPYKYKPISTQDAISTLSAKSQAHTTRADTTATDTATAFSVPSLSSVSTSENESPTDNLHVPKTHLGDSLNVHRRRRGPPVPV